MKKKLQQDEVLTHYYYIIFWDLFALFELYSVLF